MKTITICGSMRFYPEMYDHAVALTARGTAVYFPFEISVHVPGVDLAKLHRDKIQESDGILVVNVGGYIGEHTQSEIDYAQQLNKDIEYVYEEK